MNPTTRHGSALVKIRLGEAPHGLPTALDVRARASVPAGRLGVPGVDRAVGRYAPGAQISLVHTPAAARGRAGARAHYDDLEHVCGLSRTYRIVLGDGRRASTLVDALRDSALVESSSREYLALTQPAALVAAAVPDHGGDASRTWDALSSIGGLAAMAYEPGDPTLIIGLVDTGVLAGHPDMGAAIRTGVDTVELGRGSSSSGVELLGDERDYDTDPHDEVGHGTACAVLMVGRGIALPPGLAGACSLLPARALGAARLHGRVDRMGIGAIGDIDDALKRVVDLGARVLNLSFGTDLATLDPAAPVPHADVVRYALARGCVLVAAAGNCGRPARYTPAALPGVLAVGAVGGDGRPARFSASGDHVAIAAPGERLAAAGLDGYGTVSGTSFAAPLVCAAAALLVSRAARRAVALDASEVGELLAATAAPWPAGTPSGNGAGVLDVLGALRALDRRIDAGAPVPRSPRPSTPPTGGIQ